MNYVAFAVEIIYSIIVKLGPVLLAVYYGIKLYQEFRVKPDNFTKERAFQIIRLLISIALAITWLFFIGDADFRFVDVLFLTQLFTLIVCVELIHLVGAIIPPEASNYRQGFIKLFLRYKNLSKILNIIALILLLTYTTLLAYFPGFLGAKDRIIVVQSDCGNDDLCMALILGLIHSENPHARVYYLSNGVTALNVNAAAKHLASTAKFMPSGTIFLALTSPGGLPSVDLIAFETKNGCFFVGPDNGVFECVEEEFGFSNGVTISKSIVANSSARSLTQGREVYDFLSPIAARLSVGHRLRSLGTPLQGIKPFANNFCRCSYLSGVIQGVCTHIDEFHNIHTNIDPATLDSLGLVTNDNLDIFLKKDTVKCVPFKTHYSDVSVGEMLCLLKGDGLQISIRQNGGMATLPEAITAFNIGDTIVLRRSACGRENRVQFDERKQPANGRGK